MTELELRVRGGENRDRGAWGRGGGGGGDREIRGRLRLDIGESVEIVARGIDQTGSRFPDGRFAIGIDSESCDAVTVDNRRADGFRLQAGRRRGECEVVVWVPGNLNLERSIRVEVGGRDDRYDRNDRDRDDRDRDHRDRDDRDRDDRNPQRGWNRAESERIAHRLYNSILVRVPDPEGLRDTIVEIQAGRLEKRIEQMVKSPEFRRRRSSPQEYLNEYYKGLLHRDVDSGGVRVYLDDVKRGSHLGVVLAIVRSDEFFSQVRDK